MKALRTIFAILLALYPVAASAQEVRILVPVFSGDDRLGKTVANLLRLQVSQTFQVAGTATTAIMILRDQPLSAPEHVIAQRTALDPGALCHLILWGQAYHYQDGVAIETHLSTTSWLRDGRASRPEIWEISIPGTGIELRSELPREIYEMPTRVLSLEAAQHYADFDGLVIYKDRTFTTPIGRFRDVYRALRYWPDAAEIRSGGVTGYVPLPYVTEARTEAVDFVAGYIRMLRGDWAGAEERFRRIYLIEQVTPEIAVDTRLFLGLVEEKRGRSGLRYFEEALSRNPYDRAAASYLLLGRLADVLRKAGGQRAAAGAALTDDIARYRPLFPEDGQWIPMLERASHYLKEGTR